MSRNPVDRRSTTNQPKPGRGGRGQDSDTGTSNGEDEGAASFEDVIDEIERKIGPILPASTRVQVVERVVSVLRREQFEGPIAHPRHLAEYEKICPGAADRIIRMAEEEQASRIKLRDAQIVLATSYQTNERDDRRRGMQYGFIAFLVLAAGAVFCGWIGQPVLGGVFLATSALSAVAVFVNGRRHSQQAAVNTEK